MSSIMSFSQFDVVYYVGHYITTQIQTRQEEHNTIKEELTGIAAVHTLQYTSYLTNYRRNRPRKQNTEQTDMRHFGDLLFLVSLDAASVLVGYWTQLIILLQNLLAVSTAFHIVNSGKDRTKKSKTNWWHLHFRNLYHYIITVSIRIIDKGMTTS